MRAADARAEMLVSPLPLAGLAGVLPGGSLLPVINIEIDVSPCRDGPRRGTGGPGHGSRGQGRVSTTSPRRSLRASPAAVARATSGA